MVKQNQPVRQFNNTSARCALCNLRLGQLPKFCTDSRCGRSRTAIRYYHASNTKNSILAVASVSADPFASIQTSVNAGNTSIADFG